MQKELLNQGYQKTSRYDELKKLMEQNLEYSKRIFESVEKTRKYVLWNQILTIVKIVIILVPIILAFIYLPPLFKDAMEFYKETLGGGAIRNLLN